MTVFHDCAVVVLAVVFAAPVVAFFAGPPFLRWAKARERRLIDIDTKETQK